MTLPALLIATLILTQTAVTPTGEKAWNAFLESNFQQIDRLLGEAFATEADSTVIAEVLLAKGAAVAMKGEKDKATDLIVRAFGYDPRLERTSLQLPPPVWKAYAEAKKQQKALLEEPKVTAEPKMVAEPPVQPQATNLNLMDEHWQKQSRHDLLKSLAMPGWGHLPDERTRGMLLMSVELVSLAGFIYYMSETSANRDNYLSERDPLRIDSAYDDYNRARKLAISFGVISAGNYLYTQYDLLTR